MKDRIKEIIIFMVLFLCSIIIVGSLYYNKSYSYQDFDTVLYVCMVGAENASPDVVSNIVFTCMPYVVFAQTILILPLLKNIKNKLCMDIKFKKKEFSFQLFPTNHSIIYTVLVFIISIFICLKCFGIIDYFKNRTQNTKIYEEYYVDGRDVNITFPKNKRNLIIIIGESFENTVFSKENGGAWDYSLMPELEKLALKNTSFSNSKKIGGAIQVSGANFSAGGNIAITSGVPLKTAQFLNNNDIYQGSGNYLPGVYSLR